MIHSLNLKLNIILYGENASDNFSVIFGNNKIKLNDENKYNIPIKIGNDEKNHWKYFVISGSNNEQKNDIIKSILREHIESEKLLTVKVKEEIEKMKKDTKNKTGSQLIKLSKDISSKLSENRKFYDVLIIIVDRLNSENSKFAFEFFQNLSERKTEQPFILYLTKNENNPNIDQLYQSINSNKINPFFDKRNLSAFKFPQTSNEFKNFNDYLMKCLYYYHEKGTLTSDREITHSFNILICGPSGSGKSTFINQFLQEKQAKEGEGFSVTQEIVKYYHKQYPITIYDTPGFENEETVNMVSAVIDQLKENINNSKDHLDLIIYYCNLERRTFLDMEIKLIKDLCQSKNIIFVVNTFGKAEKGKLTIKLLNDKKDSLRQILKDVDIKISNPIVDNMTLVNQISTLDENDDGEPILKKAYGMDNLFKKLYEIFKKEKILINEINNSKNVEEMMKIIQKFNLLLHITKIEDIIINNKITASKTILSFSRYVFFVVLFRDYRRKELLSELRRIYNDKSNEDINSLYLETYQKVEKIEDPEKESYEFFNSIKRFKDIFDTEGFTFDAWFYNQFTLLMGHIFIKRYEKDFGHYDEKSKDFIRDLAMNINKGIDGFKAIGEEWGEIYKELKEGDVKRDWVKKFFIFETKK